ncbi:MAG: Glu-tRNA(Gln) amidotransferase subunit GatE [Methanospirillum sp.]|nr:Glu-tRNA(Gln) amidotransferase subunit GatE [Methanospirillum sp.]
MDFEKVGLVAGIEIHQQLDTTTKLFCGCPTAVRPVEEHDGEFFRYLRATASELGEIDRAAEEEMKQVRRFRYLAYDTTCLVENDDEPPSPLNEEALEVTLQAAKAFGMTPIEQVHVMRKLVIDGSNTSGFQRTALVAVGGLLPNGGRIDSICLEEEAAQRVEDACFSLDRLGIPLVEITTSPCLRTPDEVRETAAHIGMVLRSTGRVKRGIGTIRQDLNVSIREGARVEIKGVQELDLIAEVVRREVARQMELLEIRAELLAREARVEDEPVDVSGIFAKTASSVLKRAPVVLALCLRGFSGLVGRELQPGRRLGSELSDYAKKCGVGGIFHTDELPAYGVTPAEVDVLRSALGAADRDCVVLVSGTRSKTECAVRQVARRARCALEGVPEETRRMLEGGSSAYMRPLPGAARMYPETDVLPVSITGERWAAVGTPELLTERARRFEREYGLDASVARQLADAERLPLFLKAVGAGVGPSLAARTVLATLKELSRDGVSLDRISDDDVAGVLVAVETGRAGKEAVPALLRAVAEGSRAEEAVAALGPAPGQEELDAIVERVIAERAGFIAERGMAALGPLMGVVMAEAGGAADGRAVSELLRRALKRALE